MRAGLTLRGLDKVTSLILIGESWKTHPVFRVMSQTILLKKPPNLFEIFVE